MDRRWAIFPAESVRYEDRFPDKESAKLEATRQAGILLKSFYVAEITHVTKIEATIKPIPIKEAEDV
jgi:hypothetical protein